MRTRKIRTKRIGGEWTSLPSFITSWYSDKKEENDPNLVSSSVPSAEAPIKEVPPSIPLISGGRSLFGKRRIKRKRHKSKKSKNNRTKRRSSRR